MSNALLLSLGHNSSAIYTNGTSNIGYETERLDRVKSSSASPIKAIHEIEKHSGVKINTPVFVTHWYDSFDKKLILSKHTQNLDKYISDKGSKLITHTKNFTHHDVHAWSAYSFYLHWAPGYKFLKSLEEDYHIIVADGFGNYQEVISIYKFTPGSTEPELVDRIYGYENSMGLMYQYATDFVGMKMYQDEYKFLGYESLIGVFTKKQIKKIQDAVEEIYPRLLRSRGFVNKQDPNEAINLNDLEATRLFWEVQFMKLLTDLKIADRTSSHARIVIGFYIQSLLELRFYYLVRLNNIKNLLVAGGVFYNVKLNNFLLQSIKGYFSAVPLAGDQGAAIGFYQKYVGQFNWSTLAIGERGFYKEDINYLDDPSNNIYVVKSQDEALNLLHNKLKSNEICNLVTNKMEYGPRALGHTSSLFLPTEENSEINNSLNNRNDVMPFAPIMSEYHMSSKFDKNHYSRVIGSDQFMIVTYDYIDKPTSQNAGVYHKYPLIDKCSGRPQIVTQENNILLYKLFFNLMAYDTIGMLTNTSYNYHGEPIVFSMMDILATHQKQQVNAKRLNAKINLVIYKIEE